MDDSYKLMIIEALANAPAANLEKITKHVQTLCEGMSDDSYKTYIIKALITASTKANFNEITNAAITLCEGMSDNYKHAIIESLAIADPDNLEKILKVVETLCEECLMIPSKTDIIEALANAPTANLDKITKPAQTLCSGMIGYYKTNDYRSIS